MKTECQFVDGYMPPAGRQVTIAPRIKYPFKDYPDPDMSAKWYERDYDVPPGRYTPRIAVRSSGNPDTDPDDATAYLVAETDPEQTDSAIARVVRTFAHIPDEQRRPISYPWTKPVFPSTTFNDYLISTVDPAEIAQIYGLSKALSSEVYKVSGGTYTITINGTYTTAPINWNAGAAAIKAAIDTAVGGGCNCTVSEQTANQAYSVTGLGTGGIGMVTAVVINVASLTSSIGGTPVGAAGGLDSGAFNFYYHLSLSYYTSTSHGIGTGSQPGVFNSNVANTVTATISDANTIAIPRSSTQNGAQGYTSFRAFVRDYLPGSARFPGEMVEKFYLPGASGEPATAADIPIAEINASDNAFLLAMCAGETVLTVDFRGPETWIGPILKTEETQITVP